MIIVSNTSPLTNLAAIGQFDLLHHLYSEIHIAEGVWNELNAGEKQWPGSKEVVNSYWVYRHVIQNQFLVKALRRDLDLGESESIALALELKADIILLDENDGRNAARRFNLKPVGVIGILLEAKKKHRIELIRPHLDALRQIAGFRLSKGVYMYALELADE
jgi:hypothetical protein